MFDFKRILLPIKNEQALIRDIKLEKIRRLLFSSRSNRAGFNLYSNSKKQMFSTFFKRDLIRSFLIYIKSCSKSILPLSSTLLVFIITTEYIFDKFYQSYSLFFRKKAQCYRILHWPERYLLTPSNILWQTKRGNFEIFKIFHDILPVSKSIKFTVRYGP